MKKKNKKIHLSVPYIDFNEKKQVIKSVERNEISSYGRNVSLFEKRISKLTGAKYNLAVNTGSSALLLALISSGVKENDLIITQSYTFTATTNSIIHSGATPWLFDIDKENYSINLNDVKKILTDNCYKRGKFYYHRFTKQRVFAICPVFSFSIVPRLDKLRSLAKKFNLKIILDSACAINSKFYKTNFINFADIAIFSFNGNKSFTTGSGGLVSTNSKYYHSKAKLFSENSKFKGNYSYLDIGYNLRMNNLNASIGLEQIKKFKKIKTKKKLITKKYKQLEDIEFLKMLPCPVYSKHLLWINCLILLNSNDAKKIIYLLKKNHVQTNYFWKPMHLQVFKKKFLIEKNMNNTNHIWNKIVPLPSSAGLESIDQNKIISLIKKYFNKR